MDLGTVASEEPVGMLQGRAGRVGELLHYYAALLRSWVPEEVRPWPD